MKKNDKKNNLNVAEIPGLIEYAHHSGSAPIQPENLDQIRSNNLNAMTEQTSEQLRILYEQFETVATQVKIIKERVEFSKEVYGAHIGFNPVVNQNYYLYQNKTGKLLSMVSPEEWGNSPPYTFIATVQLLTDHTWQKISENNNG